ncbi:MULTISPECIES: hypothetical protein [unclassified Enterococcus]|uniref:hypothetical protein n=1 Tax=unclassified Enterococcus TaxID=2608891 RepID=UPI001A9116EA|nr:MULTISPECIES: hypothetical protein [unclassified Enterococcus]MBO0461132.1 hypothetical protein [Enterococcus sp. DIV1298c]MBO1300277.1 hypothetical protein [Enterococcus sp. DIV1271a]
MAKETAIIDQIHHLQVEETQLDLFQALEYLETENRRVLMANIQGHCRLRIYDRKGVLLLEKILQFPLTEEIEEVLDSDWEKVKETNKTEKKMLFTDPSNRWKKYQLSRIDWKKIIQRLLLSGVIVFVVIRGASMFVGQSANNEPKVTEDSQNISWQSLVEAGAYDEAAEKYPDQYQQLLDHLVEQQEFSWVEKLNEQRPTGNATFDLAFYQKDWETVIVTHVEQLTEQRQVKLAIAYLELEQIEEAVVLNRHINQPEITLTIDQFYLQESLDWLKEKEIDKAKELSQNIQTEELKAVMAAYIEQAAIILDFIRFYEDSSDRSDSVKLWEERLARLGESVE